MDVKGNREDPFQPAFWIRSWEAARKNSSGAGKIIRSDSEMNEYWNRIAASYDQAHSNQEPSERVQTVLNILRREQLLKPDWDILDIGCGPGNFTIPLADACRSVTALDSASEMCRQLLNKIENLGLKNVTVLHHLWEELDLKQTALEEKFDLSFASMTTAIFNLDTLMKMNKASRNSCCLIFWAENGSNRVRDDLYQLLFKAKDSGSGMPSVIYPFNLLYSLGYFPKIEFINSGWSTTEPVEKAIDSLCNYFWLYTDVVPAHVDIIARYVREHAVDGALTRETKTRLGVVTWNV